MTPFAFLSHHPEFQGDPSGVAFWLTVGAKMVNPDRWGDLTDHGIALFAAHNLALDIQIDNAVATGGVPGLATGPMTSKSIDKVSVSYDVAGAIEQDAGHWNLTVYGRKFIRLSRMMGAGGLQL